MDFTVGVYLSAAQNPIPPPLHIEYVYTVKSMYVFTHRRGEEELNQREGERGNSWQSWVENTNMTDCISSL